jgi:hypothetical protein
VAASSSTAAIAEHQRGRQDIGRIVFHDKTVGCLQRLAVRDIKLDIAQQGYLLGVKKTRSVQDKQNQGESGQLAVTGNVHEKRG